MLSHFGSGARRTTHVISRRRLQNHSISRLSFADKREPVDEGRMITLDGDDVVFEVLPTVVVGKEDRSVQFATKENRTEEEENERVNVVLYRFSTVRSLHIHRVLQRPIQRRR